MPADPLKLAFLVPAPDFAEEWRWAFDAEAAALVAGGVEVDPVPWTEAADLIISSLEKAIGAKTVTYDFARLMDGAKEIKTSEFADEMIKHM